MGKEREKETALTKVVGERRGRGERTTTRFNLTCTFSTYSTASQEPPTCFHVRESQGLIMYVRTTYPRTGCTTIPECRVASRGGRGWLPGWLGDYRHARTTYFFFLWQEPENITQRLGERDLLFLRKEGRRLHDLKAPLSLCGVPTTIVLLLYYVRGKLRVGKLRRSLCMRRDA